MVTGGRGQPCGRWFTPDIRSRCGREGFYGSCGHRNDGGRKTAGQTVVGYSHSMVPGGFEVMSTVTRLISRTSLVIRVEIRSSTS